MQVNMSAEEHADLAADEVDPAVLAARAAQDVGADDVLVLVPLGNGHWGNRGGIGRGKDWASCLDVEVEDAPLLHEALESGQVVRVGSAADGARSEHVLGPYFARAAAIVAVSGKAVVVFGSRPPTAVLDAETTQLLVAAPDQLLRDVADELVVAGLGPDPAKALADEVTVLQAIRGVTQSLDLAFKPALEHVVKVAASHLGADLAMAVTGRRQIAVADHGWPLQGDRRAAAAVIVASFGHIGRPVRVQDAERTPLPEPFSPAAGVRAYLALPIAPPAGGTLLFIRAGADPRGFTKLDQRVAEQLVEAAAVLLQVAELRQELLEQLDRSLHEARHDPLTGAENRLAWDEAMVAAQRAADGGDCVSLVIVDLDGLKTANDQHGHSAGDRLIAALAESLLRGVGDRDTVARLGGDEFGIVLRGACADEASRTLARLRESLTDVRTDDGLPLLASLGSATCEPHGSIQQTWHDADQAMYADKRRHNARTRARRAALSAGFGATAPPSEASKISGSGRPSRG
jgi:diguanylate cyclase (GGDEF)-like protein